MTTNPLTATFELGQKVQLTKELSDLLPAGTVGRVKEAHRDIYLVDFSEAGYKIPITVFQNELERPCTLRGLPATVVPSGG